MDLETKGYLDWVGAIHELPLHYVLQNPLSLHFVIQNKSLIQSLILIQIF